MTTKHIVLIAAILASVLAHIACAQKTPSAMLVTNASTSTTTTTNPRRTKSPKQAKGKNKSAKSPKQAKGKKKRTKSPKQAKGKKKSTKSPKQAKGKKKSTNSPKQAKGKKKSKSTNSKSIKGSTSNFKAKRIALPENVKVVDPPANSSELSIFDVDDGLGYTLTIPQTYDGSQHGITKCFEGTF